MSARPLQFDLSTLDAEAGRTRTRWSMTASAVGHVLLILLLTSARPAPQETESITEVTLLDAPGAPAAAAAAPASAPAPAKQTTPGATQPSPEQRFRRELNRGDLAPQPQSDQSAFDRIDARLQALQSQAAVPASAGLASGAPAGLWSAPKGVPGGTGASPIALRREGGAGGSPIALARGGAGGSALGTAAQAPEGSALQAAEAPRDERAVRQAAGATLAGPIADRRIVHYVTPVYPEWAKRDGVEASVTLYFVVRADGTVKENVLVQKTAGFGDFDENAQAALREWRFEPLRGGESGEQWGTITLHYKLRG